MLLDHPPAPARNAASALRSPIVELRQYTLHPGRRDTLIDLFEREFLDTQEAAGMRVLGQFRDLDAPDRFVWLRGFEDMASRRASLEAFYDGPAWRAHRDAPVDLDFLEFFAAELHPSFAAAGASAIASFTTEYATNTFPRLPVREGEHVFAWFSRFADVATHAAFRERLVAAPEWRARAVALAQRLQGPPQILRLAPTSRSRLR